MKQPPCSSKPQGPPGCAELVAQLRGWQCRHRAQTLPLHRDRQGAGWPSQLPVAVKSEAQRLGFRRPESVRTLGSPQFAA